MESSEAVINSTSRLNIPLCSFLLFSPLSHRNCHEGQHHPRQGSHCLYFLNTSFSSRPPLCFYYKLLPVRHLNILNCLSDPLVPPTPHCLQLPPPFSPLLDSQISPELSTPSLWFSLPFIPLSILSSFCHTHPTPLQKFSLRCQCSPCH